MTTEDPTQSRAAGDADREGNSLSIDEFGLRGATEAAGLGPAVPSVDSLLGTIVGGVLIQRLIAEGGMGRVYEGRQEKPQRSVAVKVMRPGLTSPSLLRRFEFEAEVLGRLQHPGIAHIYSFGVHHLGNAEVPFFVMEYIADARPLTKYAADLGLSTNQRLKIFRNVCDAVAYGHQKGVIHRDLKPSNILVDGFGHPKVIDFGIARATDSDLTTVQHDVGQFIGTLQYMSPEQIQGKSNDVDIRSDVYALGVVLYELLAGKPPYAVKDRSLLEVMRIVTEDDPPPLSSLDSTLPADLDDISSKCLTKEKVGRYSSALELSTDISRHLDGEPILAEPNQQLHASDTLPTSVVETLFRLATWNSAADALIDSVIPHLKTLTPSQARYLAARPCFTNLIKLDTISSERLVLAALTELSPEVATELAKHSGDLLLDGLTTLSPEAAQALAKKHKSEDPSHCNEFLDYGLGGILAWGDGRSIDDTIRSPILSLNGLTRISSAVAEALAGFKGDLHLDGLTTLLHESAVALANNKGRLFIRSLHAETLPRDVLAVLVKHNGPVFFSDRTTALPISEVLTLQGNEYDLAPLVEVCPDVTPGGSSDDASFVAEHEGRLYLDQPITSPKDPTELAHTSAAGSSEVSACAAVHSHNVLNSSDESYVSKVLLSLDDLKDQPTVTEIKEDNGAAWTERKQLGDDGVGRRNRLVSSLGCGLFAALALRALKKALIPAKYQVVVDSILLLLVFVLVCILVASVLFHFCLWLRKWLLAVGNDDDNTNTSQTSKCDSAS